MKTSLRRRLLLSMIWATSYWIPLPLLRPSSSFYPRAPIVQFFPALANATPTLYQLSIQIRDEEGWGVRESTEDYITTSFINKS